jgi:putative DNA primase/helicase
MQSLRPPGATLADWTYLSGLGLTEDLLPVVSDTSARISPRSKIKDVGKTPSTFNRDGDVVGLKEWTQQRSTRAQVDQWAQNDRLGICLQTRQVRAIDVDIPDAATSAAVRDLVAMLVGDLPCRWRANSGKLLLAFHMPGEFSKRIIRCGDAGAIEFLATGQQFIAHGTHPSGARYTWDGLDVCEVLGGFPVVGADEFEALWAGLADIYGVEGSTTTKPGQQPLTARQRADINDPVVDYLEQQGLVLGIESDGKVHVTCPWKAEHSGDSGPSETSWLPAGVGGIDRGNFKCLHAHCAHRGADEFLGAVGYTDTEFEAQPVMEGVERKGVPEARHLTTDQANAGRIVRQFGKRLIVMAGQWFAWTGKRWEKDDSEVYRCGCRLSKLIHEEADEWRAKKTGDEEQMKTNLAVAEALKKWAQKSEMKASIEAALGLAKKLLAVPEDALDRNPWLLNCANGTVDLRTGEIKKHDPGDFITKLVPLAYDPAARSAAWDTVTARVTLEEGMTTRPLARFLQRWFGYCATGSTREQAFVVHYGQGSNGKSTILDTVADVLGDYAATAAPGLMVGNAKDRHPTEVADLHGRRMVTSHETGEGGQLKEDVVKQLTGSDKVKARFMRADFFEFDPTHKLQLLTNHKPAIKGQDNGIWRRVLLMPYLARFAVAEEVAAGRAHFVRDTRIMDRLAAEKQGVLAWVIEGAKAWAQDGLQPPDAVLAASRDYQTEQDRVGQFLADCCEFDPAAREPLAGGFGDGLYGAYKEWATSNGIFHLSKQKFADELKRAIPCGNVVEGREPETRRKVRWVVGVRLLAA